MIYPGCSFAVLLFIIGSEYNQHIHPATYRLINWKIIKGFLYSLRSSSIDPRCDQNQFFYLALGLTKPADKKGRATAVPNQYRTLIHYIFFKLLLESAILGEPRIRHKRRTCFYAVFDQVFFYPRDPV